MNKLLISLLLILIVHNSLLGQNAIEIAKKCLPSTLSLIMEDNYKQPISLGSGFIVETGKVATNLHVIEGAKYGYVLINGSSTKHKIEGYISIDKQNDLAILSVPTITGKPLQLASLPPEIGEKIYAIGNPKGLSGTISEGIISGIRNLENKKLIQITASISPGSSGGPVLGNSGQVIGVAVGTLTSGQNLNFAIPASLLLSLLNNGNRSITSLNISKGSTAPKIREDENNIKDGITVRNPNYKTGLWTSGGIEKHHKLLLNFSIRNNLPYQVSDILVLFIVYDKFGVPLDYIEKKYLNTYSNVSNKYYHSPSVGIKPFLAKTFSIEKYSSNRVFRLENSAEKIEIRILDFRISEN